MMLIRDNMCKLGMPQSIVLVVFSCYELQQGTRVLPLSQKMTPLDTSIRKKSGILSKRHIILVELN